MHDVGSGLRALGLAACYRNGQHDIASAFYVPALAQSKHYSRAVGFFSSSIYALGWAGLRQFLGRGGTCRLICSPRLSDDDLRAVLRGYLSKNDAVLVAALKAELDTLFVSSETAQPAEVLATLVAIGALEIRLAILEPTDASNRRMFHDKVGIFKDEHGDTVAFKGSMNETWSGLSSHGNLESVDVFVSWGDAREMGRVRDEVSFFEALWEGRWPGAAVRSLPDAVSDEVIRRGRPDDVDALITALEAASKGRHPAGGSGTVKRQPLPHQIEALGSWEASGRRGVLCHATGSGKTFTALMACQAALRRGEVVVVVVPSVLLLRQWRDEIAAVLGSPAPRVLVCGGTDDRWRRPGLLVEWTRQGPEPRMVITTDATASDPVFLGRLRFGRHLMLVADEVHHLGSQRNRSLLAANWGGRLGLSATPDRAGDAEGTAAIRKAFGPDLQPAYGIGEAIADGRLCRYFYYPHIVQLTSEEHKRWTDLTRRLAIAIGGTHSPDQWSPECRALLLRRARILKKASAKIDLGVDIVSTHYMRGGRWLVYCDDTDQLQAVVGALRPCIDAPVMEYHSAMTGDPTTTLRVLADTGGVVVAIRCLDEGVDIPAADTSLILASSQNPREFIQRRGRVLRTAPGKVFATVHDVIVTPSEFSTLGSVPTMTHSEIARAVEFGQYAENPMSVRVMCGEMLALGIDLRLVAGLGLENDDGDFTT